MAMISTAVMVGEISAMDWASRVGKPSAFFRSPGCDCEEDGGSPLVNVVMVRWPLS